MKQEIGVQQVFGAHCMMKCRQNETMWLHPIGSGCWIIRLHWYITPEAAMHLEYPTKSRTPANQHIFSTLQLHGCCIILLCGIDQSKPERGVVEMLLNAPTRHAAFARFRSITPPSKSTPYRLHSIYAMMPLFLFVP